LLTQPDETWAKVRTEHATVTDLLRDYVFRLAAIPSAAHFLGFWAILGFWKSLGRAALFYLLAVVAVWMTARVIGLLSAQYDVDEDEAKVFKLAAYSLTPYLAAGVCYLIPPLMVLVPVGGLFGFYLLLRGLPIVMGVAEDRSVSYAGFVTAFMFLLFLAIGRLTGGVFWPAKP
jgi:hypothetical protein